MKKQNKKIERNFFDSIAMEGSYELTPKKLFKKVFALLKKRKIVLKGNMLEAGCGTGAWGKQFLKEFKILSITGIDISKKMADKAKDGTKQYKALAGDLENTKLFRNKYFDSILCPAVLHHLPNPSKTFKNLSYWIKPGGILVIIEPNGSNIVGMTSKFIRHIGELIFGNGFLLKTKLATPNEVDHSLDLYKEKLAANHFTIIDLHLCYVEPPRENISGIGLIKTISSRFIHERFPNSKYTNTTLLIIAKKDK